MCRASCFRRTRFSALIEDDERQNSMPNRTTSAREPMIARNTGHMCAPCQIQLMIAGAVSRQPHVVNYYGPPGVDRRNDVAPLWRDIASR